MVQACKFILFIQYKISKKFKHLGVLFCENWVRAKFYVFEPKQRGHDVMGAPGADGREGKLEDTDIQNFLNLFNFQCPDF